MRGVEWLLVGAGAYVALTRRAPSAVAWGAGWQWPVPDVVLGDRTYKATITQGFKPTRHKGVDVMYRRRSSTDLVSVYPPKTHNGSASAFALPDTPILAARDGVVWRVTKTARGWSVVLDHGKPWATFYQHLERVTLRSTARGAVVARGTVLGTMGWDPMDAEGLRHLHFETWYQGDGKAAVDPADAMRSWARATWTPVQPAAVAV